MVSTLKRRAEQLLWSNASPSSGALSQWSLLAADKMEAERYWKSYLMCKALLMQRVSCTPPQQQPAYQSGATDMYHPMHTCKCPVFLCLSDWKTAAMRKVPMLILLGLCVRHDFWMHKMWILFSVVPAPLSTKQKEQSGFSFTGSLTFPIGKKSLTLSRDLGEHTRNFLIGTAAMLMRFTEHVDLSPCALSCRISMWSGKWAGFSFPSLAELAARQAVASLCRVGHSTAGHGTAGVPARGGCRWGTTCNITSCPQIITARQASDLQSCSSLHFSISPLKRFQEKIKIQSLSAGRQSRQCWAAARQSAALSLPPAAVSWCASLILMLPMFRFHLYSPPIFLPLGKI